MDTLTQVIKELHARKGDWPQIAREADVSYSWITKFAQNRIPNPGITTIMRLSEILDKRT